LRFLLALELEQVISPHTSHLHVTLSHAAAAEAQRNCHFRWRIHGHRHYLRAFCHL
jgi:hypothetical protein